ncbi:hypothetical protein [Micromonospora sp. NPDC049679]|uniref:hypothetical protein n=1 Tax=Micromonospora sp. NPDC049679 TaxID=3155920 RepID=UPI0033CBC110
MAFWLGLFLAIPLSILANALTGPTQRLISRYNKRYRDKIAAKRAKEKRFASLIADKTDVVTWRLIFHFFQALRGVVVLISGIVLAGVSSYFSQPARVVPLIAALLAILAGNLIIISTTRQGVQLYFDAFAARLLKAGDDSVNPRPVAQSSSPGTRS